MAKGRLEDTEIEETIVETVGTTENNYSGSSEAWFDKNKTLVLGILAALVLAIALFAFYKYVIKEPKEKAAKAALYQAEQYFAQDSFALALESRAGIEAEGLLDVIDNYKGTKTANLAKLYAGISYLNLGRFDEAISYLESHSGAGTYSPILKFGNLGDAYSEQGDFGAAISNYSKATTAGEDALLTPYYLYKLGLLARKEGDKGKALSAFKAIKTRFPESNEASTIDLLINSVS